MLLYRLPVLIMSTCRKSSKIGMWADANYLQFIIEKCKVVRVTRKRTGTQPPALYLHSQPLQEVDSYKYLEVLLSSDFYQHSSPERLLQMYLTLVCPHLDYVSQVWKTSKIGGFNEEWLLIFFNTRC